MCVVIRTGSETLITFHLGMSTDRHDLGWPRSTFAATPPPPRRIQKRAQLFIFLLLLILPSGAFAQGACPAGLPVSGNHCYFIAANGSDSNSGTSESSPWLHASGMPNCSGVCAKVTPSPGQGFILRGGDTWHFGNSSPSSGVATGGGWNINQQWGTDSSCIYEGTQSGCIYYGVDPTWYNPANCSSWCRPILTGDNPTSTSAVSSCAHQVGGSFWGNNTMIQLGVATILDNFELTGMCMQDTSVSPGGQDIYIAYGGTGMAGSGMGFMTNLYIHGWTSTTAARTAAAAGTLIGGGYNGLETIDHVVIDGSDSLPDSWEWGTYPSFYHMRDSIVRYTSNGVGQWCHDIHDNIFEYIVWIVGGGHTNILECNNDSSGNAVNQPQNTPNVVYNNIVRHSNSNVMLWFCPNTIPEYWFNNLIYDSEGEGWSIAGPPAYSDCPNSGHQYMFNNTFVDGNSGGWLQPCFLNNLSTGGQYLTVYNEHLINTSFDSGSKPCTGVSSATNVSMTEATATAQGYTTGSRGTYLSNTCASEPFAPCTPTASSNSTVAAGSNEQAYCTQLGSYASEAAIGTDAAKACRYSTTDGCLYDTVSHSMICNGSSPSPVLRPTAIAWDSGAYQFSGISAPTAPSAPTNLRITASH